MEYIFTNLINRKHKVYIDNINKKYFRYFNFNLLMVRFYTLLNYIKVIYILYLLRYQRY